ncbi:MAG: type II toxin-antitoxin system ParD family antitoxin [Oscillatoriales cyanobacterium RU_3_3]|nr:type II toxin-antitoxin system ParD family antitoxin [Microcoleus sp. SU_5_6]NJL69171.1 type II toxin-antitoxin system ParD family antitoxin [Microcoleus sp. SM1_3_4]NJM62733.1 type II toxin-antitoxin system ParD family antitoxin [Oscillatoriales cyanobacterium RU_3_3]NJR25073.1 type II toxin-antitoxin system ParD family antitoxin [Richelia sp. CSU_2_1]
MSITLSPEQEQLIQAQLATGRYSSQEEVLSVALLLLQKFSDDYATWLEETRQKVKIGLDQIERGEVLDSETVIAQLEQKIDRARRAGAS